MFRDKICLVVAVLLFLVGGVFFKVFPNSDFWKVDIASFLGLVASISTAIGVGVAVYFGKRGLDTWKHQNRAAIDNDLVRRISLPLLRYADLMVQLRSPIMYGNESEPDEGEKTDGTWAQERHKEVVRAYRRRLDPVNKARLEVYACLLEAQFFWGDELAKLYEEVFKFEKEFTSYLRAWLISTNPDAAEDMREAYKTILSKKKDVLYDEVSDEGDEFRQGFNRQVDAMKVYLKNKLEY